MTAAQARGIAAGELPERRYASVPARKSTGATYTPQRLADFVAHQVVEVVPPGLLRKPLRVLDPAVGDGALLLALISRLRERSSITIEACGYDTDRNALETAERRLREAGVDVGFEGIHECFLERARLEPYDVIIANPPYVRSQVMGATRARSIAKRYGLSGRVDLAHAFLVEIMGAIEPLGVAGLIVSNRFMFTRSGSAVRHALTHRAEILRVWDFGDTRLFDAAVLPAVLLLRGGPPSSVSAPAYTRIYETSDEAALFARDPIEAVDRAGVVAVQDGRRFLVQHGRLRLLERKGAVWHAGLDSEDSWLTTVERHCWGRFREIGRVRVGVKTCADSVFCGPLLQDLSSGDRPELLHRLTTHRAARPYRAVETELRWMLYPHEVVDGVRSPVSLESYPKTRAYLQAHRDVLNRRSYVVEAGRKWYEIWVPQDPAAWAQPKLVCRDIAARPVFWIDLDGTLVNGDCYWMVAEREANADLLLLAAAVGNSRLLLRYYDQRFNNRLYSGRRRFMTQYIEEFPLPDPRSRVAARIVAAVKSAYMLAGTAEGARTSGEIDRLVSVAFGVEGDEEA
jgi:hypothetical protein